jgi:hypothetical protein
MYVERPEDNSNLRLLGNGGGGTLKPATIKGPENRSYTFASREEQNIFMAALKTGVMPTNISEGAKAAWGWMVAGAEESKRLLAEAAARKATAESKAAGAPTSLPDGAPAGAQPEKGTNWLLVGGVAGGALLIMISIILVAKRKRR